MSRLMEDHWGVPLDVDELKAAIGLAEDLCLPWTIAHEHEGCPEVFEVPPRNDATGCAAQFWVYRPADDGGYIVQEWPTGQTKAFRSLLVAIRFCREQRGADWSE